jgi:hypothetical protein
MTADADETLVTWFWSVSLWWPTAGGGLDSDTTKGTVNLPPKAATRDVYEGIVSAARHRFRVSPAVKTTLLNLYLEPAELDAGSRP